MNIIDEILTNGVCVAEIMLRNARIIIDHVAAHADGTCTVPLNSVKGHWHPMTTPEDVEHARRLMVEAPDHCTCGEH